MSDDTTDESTSDDQELTTTASYADTETPKGARDSGPEDIPDPDGEVDRITAARPGHERSREQLRADED